MLTVGGAPVHRFTVDDLTAMVEAGVLPEARGIELEDGVLIDVGSGGPEHEGAATWLIRHFVGALSTWEVRVGSGLLAGDDFLEPDLMVVEPLPRTQRPRTARLVVEIAMISHARDRHKIGLYAAALVDEYWIVDLVAEEVVVHRQGTGDGYMESRTYHRGETIEAPEGIPPVDVAELLG